MNQYLNNEDIKITQYKILLDKLHDKFSKLKAMQKQMQSHSYIDGNGQAKVPQLEYQMRETLSRLGFLENYIQSTVPLQTEQTIGNAMLDLSSGGKKEQNKIAQYFKQKIQKMIES